MIRGINWNWGSRNTAALARSWRHPEHRYTEGKTEEDQAEPLAQVVVEVERKCEQEDEERTEDGHAPGKCVFAVSADSSPILASATGAASGRMRGRLALRHAHPFPSERVGFWYHDGGRNTKCIKRWDTGSIAESRWSD